MTATAASVPAADISVHPAPSLVFAGLTGHKSAEARRAIALKAILVGGGVLLAFAVGGNGVLDLLGIGFPAFRIAGGILLLLLALGLPRADRYEKLPLSQKS